MFGTEGNTIPCPSKTLILWSLNLTIISLSHGNDGYDDQETTKHTTMEQLWYHYRYCIRVFVEMTVHLGFRRIVENLDLEFRLPKRGLQDERSRSTWKARPTLQEDKLLTLCVTLESWSVLILRSKESKRKVSMHRLFGDDIWVIIINIMLDKGAKRISGFEVQKQQLVSSFNPIS